MQNIAWVLVTLLAATALAGCAAPPPAGEPVGTATGVTITRAAADVPANTQTTVCWRVEGSGTVPHVAVHYGPDSHARPDARFSDYPSAAYPGNATSAAAAGYALPGEFCTNVPVGDREVYFRGHVLDRDGAPGRLSDEQRIGARAGGAVIAAVTMRDTPGAAEANATVVVCWDVQGTGSIPHVAVHTDTVSRQTSASFADYKGPAYYPANRTSADPVGYTLPGSFCTGVQMPSNGTLYLRGHAMSTPPGMLSAEEKRIIVNGSMPSAGIAATVAFSGGQVNTIASRGTNVTVCWTIAGAGRIPHTAVHTDTESHAGATATFAMYRGAAYYPGNQTAADPAGYDLQDSPATFCTNVPAPGSGQITYLRAHAIDSTGGNGRLSPQERTITGT